MRLFLIVRGPLLSRSNLVHTVFFARVFVMLSLSISSFVYFFVFTFG